MADARKPKGKAEVYVTAEMVSKKEKEIVKVWLKNQMENITLRMDLISEENLEKESKLFLSAFIKAISTGNLDDIDAPVYKPTIDILGEVSRNRAVQGFTPSETATYIFSLKDTIIEFLQTEYGDQPEILNRETVVVSKLLDKLGLVTFEVYATSREDLVRKQLEIMTEMATPVMVLGNNILFLPVVGMVDSKRAQAIMEALLKRIMETESKITIIDILGVPSVDTAVANHFVKITRATKLMGCESIISGISPAVAQTLGQLGISLEGVITKATLRDALENAFETLGYKPQELKEVMKKR